MQLAMLEKVRCGLHRRPARSTFAIRVEDLAASLAEGIMTGHRAMPQFQLDSGQIADLIAYLKSLEL
jgi:hypothetical protein